MANIKVVFFDAAGTLFETRERVGQTYARIAREHGVAADVGAVDAAFRRAFAGAVPLAFGTGRTPEELRLLERDWWRNLVAMTFTELGDFDDFDAFFNSLFEFFAGPEHWVADPHALPALRALRERGLRLGVISNFDHRLYRILDGLGLSRWFDSITISSEAGYAKPSAWVFKSALQHHGLGPGEALHVGDSAHLDVAGASAAGMAAVLISRKVMASTQAGDRPRQISSLRETIEVLDLLERTPAGP
jgi:putative hydrolase of the HAD superfamily